MWSDIENADAAVIGGAGNIGQVYGAACRKS